MSAERSSTINQAKLEVARGAWKHDRQFARDIIEEIHRNEAKFRPGSAGSRMRYSWAYKVTYSLLGFDIAENLARFTRQEIRA